MKKYPFEEGDKYWIIEDGKAIWSYWDNISEDLYNKTKLYFKSQKKSRRIFK